MSKPLQSEWAMRTTRGKPLKSRTVYFRPEATTTRRAVMDSPTSRCTVRASPAGSTAVPRPDRCSTDAGICSPDCVDQVRIQNPVLLHRDAPQHASPTGHPDDSYRRGVPPHLLHEVQPTEQRRLIGLDLFGLERGRRNRARVHERHAPALSSEHRRGRGICQTSAHHHDVEQRISRHWSAPVRLARTESMLLPSVIRPRDGR